ncbi:MAG: hypothetical protein K0R00_824 [Herbinix sp.]|jgi:signal transduction histidine kinase|nr:hypothetical protein [Herbinix sp.]
MAKQEKVRIYNRLFFKLYLNYAVMLVVTAILIGLIFIKQYSNSTMENYKAEMLKQAEYISGKITDNININKDINEDFISNIKFVQGTNNWDVYTVSNPNAANKLTSDYEVSLTYDDFVAMPEYSDMVNIMDEVFEGHKIVKEYYEESEERQTITAGYPIYLSDKSVVGAVLIKKPYEESKQLVTDSLILIVTSSVVALAISFVIVIIFATELSMPITRMRITALELAAGNYNFKTGINRADEIGDLAKTVDVLANKLQENDIIRKKLDQMRLDFFANVSHELRTPITVIRAYTETLADGVVKEEEKVGQYYDRMLLECKSMERLVGDLMTLSKMQNPDFAIEKEPVNLQQVFNDIIRSAGAIASKKNISIEVIKDSPVSMILGDYDRLRQMFMVIFDNAIKFSEENTTVHINISNEEKIKVSIRDEGIGIEPEDISNIFEKFYKSNLRQNASGTGLGLSIAKQIAIKHEGTIEVVSTPNVGTEFIFTFPLLEVEEEVKG